MAMIFPLQFRAQTALAKRSPGGLLIPNRPLANVYKLTMTIEANPASPNEVGVDLVAGFGSFDTFSSGWPAGLESVLCNAATNIMALRFTAGAQPFVGPLRWRDSLDANRALLVSSGAQYEDPSEGPRATVWLLNEPQSITAIIEDLSP